MKTTRVLAIALMAAFGLLSPAAAQTLTFTTDVPCSLGGTLYPANRTLAYDMTAHVYSVTTDLPDVFGPHIKISALTKPSATVVLFCVDAPATLGGNTYQPCDIIRYEGGNFTMQESGASMGLPATANIDALGTDASGKLIFSLDAPVTVSGTTFGPSDLILVTGTSLSVYQSAASLGIPAGANVTGFERQANGDELFSFDAPVTLTAGGGPVTFVPGDVVLYTGGAFAPAPYFRDVNFPPTGALADFYSFNASFPASVPDGSANSTPLKIVKSATPGSLDLTWGASCGTGVTNYVIYEGTIGSWFSHNTNFGCGQGTGTSGTITPSSGNRYYLIVPATASAEGSYGKKSDGTERPQSTSPCIATQDLTTCP
jgi:hypothetical protein